MAIKTIHKVNCSDMGESSAVQCPNCGQSTKMRLFDAKDNSFLPALLGKEKKKIFAVCPKCGQVFGISAAYFEAISSGTIVFAESKDFLPLKND